MIILVQVEKSGMWDDMQIPFQSGVAPTRGERPHVTTVAEFAEQRRSAELIGTYGAIMDDGVMWRVVIKRVDRFIATVIPEPV